MTRGRRKTMGKEMRFIKQKGDQGKGKIDENIL
jgi:hypothetical protein